MQWIPCSVMEWSLFHTVWSYGTLLYAVDFMQHDWVQWIPWSMIECSGFYAAWPKASRLNTVDYMQRQWMRGFHALWRNGSWLYAVESMQRGPRHPDWIQWILWGMAQSIRLNAVDFMHCDWMQCTPCSEVKCIPIECSGFHAASLNADDSMCCGVMDPDCMQWSPCSVMNAWIPCRVKKWNPI